MKGKRDKDGNAQAACPQFESQTISKAISKVTISGPEAPGDEDRLVALTHLTLRSALPTPLSHFSSFSLTLMQVFPLVTGEDEDDVKSIRSHRIKMEISGHSLEESMEECRVEEMSVHKVRWNFWTVRHLLINFIPIFTIFFHFSLFIFFFSSPTTRTLYRMACRTLTWSDTHLSLMTETPLWSPVAAPATPAARRAPCAPSHEGVNGLAVSKVLFVQLAASKVRQSASSQYSFE